MDTAQAPPPWLSGNTWWGVNCPLTYGGGGGWKWPPPPPEAFPSLPSQFHRGRRGRVLCDQLCIYTANKGCRIAPKMTLSWAYPLLAATSSLGKWELLMAKPNGPSHSGLRAQKYMYCGCIFPKRMSKRFWLKSKSNPWFKIQGILSRGKKIHELEKPSSLKPLITFMAHLGTYCFSLNSLIYLFKTSDVLNQRYAWWATFGFQCWNTKNIFWTTNKEFYIWGSALRRQIYLYCERTLFGCQENDHRFCAWNAWWTSSPSSIIQRSGRPSPAGELLLEEAQERSRCPCAFCRKIHTAWESQGEWDKK